MNIRGLWEILESDLLIIGAGFGGMWSALRASEFTPSVTLVDKSFAGKSGHSFFASGARMVLLPGDNFEEYVYDITLGNEWLIEQDMVEAIFLGSYARLKDLESFGISFRKDKDGYVWTRARGTRNVKNLWLEHGTAADELAVLRRVIISKGVKILNHVYIYDLLKGEEGSIVGALGVGVKDGRNYILKAKSTILATNSGSYRGHHLACELQGTGPFMAYDLGARIKNPEFHYINIRPARHEIEGSGILPAMGGRWINAKGVYFMEEYDPVLKDRAPSSKVVVSIAKEAMKGNAPISMDVRGMTEEEREKFRILMVSHGWQPILFEKCKREEGYDILRDNIEWQPAYEANKLGIETDLNGKTKLKGLFAAGMARTLGINPFTGWSIASTTWSGYTAGEHGAKYALDAKKEALDFNYLREKKRLFFAPLRLKSGIHPDNVVHSLQKILFPVGVLIIMREERLKKALEDVLKLKKEKIPYMGATDIRTLVKAKETQTMILSAEMTLKASIMRKETRESIFYREDYQEPDNENYLKWIFAYKGKEGEVDFAFEKVPFERYRFQPCR